MAPAQTAAPPSTLWTFGLARRGPASLAAGGAGVAALFLASWLLPIALGLRTADGALHSPSDPHSWRIQVVRALLLGYSATLAAAGLGSAVARLRELRAVLEGGEGTWRAAS